VILGLVTSGCRERLTVHYGEQVTVWLDHVPTLLTEAAWRWDLRVHGYYDAGHASALATATTGEGAPVILKAWFDGERYTRETTALRHWEPLNSRVVRTQDDGRAVACLELIGGAPAGRPCPASGGEQVAAALTMLHGCPPPERNFPCLDTYLAAEVEPRIRSRTERFAAYVPRRCVELGLDALTRRSESGTRTLLHGDLYQENVPFGYDGRPVFLDPLPMYGDAAFDWAFFVVYYDMASDPAARLRLAAKASGLPAAGLLPWCLMLCIDGLLYYHEVGDSREARMTEVMLAITAESDLA
jgi:streptomycin 6-kinase